MSKSDSALHQALAHHEAGRLDQAESLYRQLLASQPNNADALHLLGMLIEQRGRNDEALGLIDRAIEKAPAVAGFYASKARILANTGRADEAVAACQRAATLKPNDADIENNTGAAYNAAGRADLAEAAFRRAIILRPASAISHFNLASALRARGSLDEAVAAYRSALSIRPDYYEALVNLGSAFIDQEKFAQAADALRAAVALQPQSPEIHLNLGLALAKGGKPAEAEACYRQALALRSDYAEAHLNLGNALRDQRRFDEALAEYRTSQRLRPGHHPVYNNIGNTFKDMGRFDDAIAEFHKCISLDPHFLPAWTNLATTLKDFGRVDEAIAIFRQVLARQPDNAVAHFNLGLTLLMHGDYAEGLREHEWRWKVPELRKAKRAHHPQWNGSPLNGQRILLYLEQGFGDMIQFARYVPMVGERGGRVVLACYPELRRLIAAQNWKGVESIVKPGEATGPIDVSCAIASVPLAFGTTLESIPNQVPYLTADMAMIEKWRSRVAALPGLKVGLLWAGRQVPNPLRTIGRPALAPLAQTSDVSFISLQKGDATAASSPGPLDPIDWTNEIDDFADTAALMHHLDLVITIDSAVAHLAGAMGKPTWVLLPFTPDWRWMFGRSDCAWYPTMRLFRQAAYGDWSAPVQQVVRELHTLVASKAGTK